MSSWIHELLDALASEDVAMLVTMAATRGSTPREAGARMIVTRGALRGTIGGGHLEFEAVRIAREALSSASCRPWLVRFPLAARMGQCCGGVATLMFQPFRAQDAWPALLAREVAVSNEASIAVAVADEAQRCKDGDALWMSGADTAALPDANTHHCSP